MGTDDDSLELAKLDVTATGSVMSSSESLRTADRGTSMEALPKFRSFSSLSASRSSSQPKSARFRLLLARAGRSPYCRALISWSAFARVRVFVLRVRGRNDVEASSAGAPVGMRTLTSAGCGLLSLRGRRPPKSSLGSVFSMPWSDGLKFCRIRRHAERSSCSVWPSRARRLIQGELSHMVSLEVCLRWVADDVCVGVGSGVGLSTRSCFEAIF